MTGRAVDVAWLEWLIVEAERIMCRDELDRSTIRKRLVALRTFRETARLRAWPIQSVQDITVQRQLEHRERILAERTEGYTDRSLEALRLVLTHICLALGLTLTDFPRIRTPQALSAREPVDPGILSGFSEAVAEGVKALEKKTGDGCLPTMRDLAPVIAATARFAALNPSAILRLSPSYAVDNKGALLLLAYKPRAQRELEIIVTLETVLLERALRAAAKATRPLSMSLPNPVKAPVFVAVGTHGAKGRLQSVQHDASGALASLCRAGQAWLAKQGFGHDDLGKVTLSRLRVTRLTEIARAEDFTGLMACGMHKRARTALGYLETVSARADCTKAIVAYSNLLRPDVPRGPSFAMQALGYHRRFHVDETAP